MGSATDEQGYERVSHVVNVNWSKTNRKWNVNDWNRDNNWNAGKRVFSPENEKFLLANYQEFSFSEDHFATLPTACRSPVCLRIGLHISSHQESSIPKLSEVKTSPDQPP